MIRSDIRATAPAEVPVIQGLLKGDVVFTNFRAAVAELRIEAGDKENEATVDLPGASENTPNQGDAQRILQAFVTPAGTQTS
jgi:hypothetical protein